MRPVFEPSTNGSLGNPTRPSLHQVELPGLTLRMVTTFLIVLKAISGSAKRAHCPTIAIWLLTSES